MRAIATERLKSVLRELVCRYPVALREAQERDIRRIAFHVRLALRCLEVSGRDLANSSVMDIGGGIGLFSLACKALGFRRVVLVDDFRDPVNEDVGHEVLDIHKGVGVEVFARDVLNEGLEGVGEGFDIITLFDTIEHWHHSPKRVLHDAVQRLVPSGWLIIGVPNCVNLRKRITVPLGYGKWTRMEDWYEREQFRGHVREPDVDDLLYIARDLRLKRERIIGRNWAGCSSASRLIRLAAFLADPLLRLSASLCSDLYLVGQRG